MAKDEIYIVVDLPPAEQVRLERETPEGGRAVEPVKWKLHCDVWRLGPFLVPATHGLEPGQLVRLKTGQGPLMVTSDVNGDATVDVMWGRPDDGLKAEHRVPACCLEPAGDEARQLNGVAAGVLSVKAADLLGRWRSMLSDSARTDDDAVGGFAAAIIKRVLEYRFSTEQHFAELTADLLEALAR